MSCQSDHIVFLKGRTITLVRTEGDEDGEVSGGEVSAEGTEAVSMRRGCPEGFQ